METATAIARLKSAAHDIADEYSTEECLHFLNAAIHEVSAILAAGNAPQLIVEAVVMEGDSVPERFIKTAGKFPVRITGDRFSLLGGRTAVNMRYFASKPLLADETGSLPFDHEAINEAVLNTAVLFALNKNSFDVTQDKVLYDELRQSLAAALGG